MSVPSTAGSLKGTRRWPRRTIKDKLSLPAHLLLDAAVEEDEARWPEAAQREQAAAHRTFAARCVGIEVRRGSCGE